MYLLLVLFCYFSVEVISYTGLIALRWKRNIEFSPTISTLSKKQKSALAYFIKNGKGVNKRIAQDPELGWVAVAESNSVGMRDSREYTVEPPGGIVRLSSFGDSFTFGADVKLNETWQKQLVRLNPSLEVLNYGSGAYGLDQAYLRYLRKGKTYKPNIVFIGFMSENIARNVNVFRAFYTSSYRQSIFTKPRFILKDGELTLLKNPISSIEDHKRFLKNDSLMLRQIGKYDYHYQSSYLAGPFDFLPSIRIFKIFWQKLQTMFVQPIFKRDGMYNKNSEAFHVTTAIFDAFYKKVLENGALPIILIYPDSHDRKRSRYNKPRRYRPLLEYLRSKDYLYIDLMTAFEPYADKYTPDDFMVSWGHFSPLAQEITAKFINNRIQEKGLTDINTVTEAIKTEKKRLDSGTSGISRTEDREIGINQRTLYLN
jgi:hypothetical protein